MSARFLLRIGSGVRGGGFLRPLRRPSSPFVRLGIQGRVQRDSVGSGGGFLLALCAALPLERLGIQGKVQRNQSADGGESYRRRCLLAAKTTPLLKSSRGRETKEARLSARFFCVANCAMQIYCDIIATQGKHFCTYKNLARRNYQHAPIKKLVRICARNAAKITTW